MITTNGSIPKRSSLEEEWLMVDPSSLAVLDKEERRAARERSKEEPSPLYRHAIFSLAYVACARLSGTSGVLLITGVSLLSPVLVDAAARCTQVVKENLGR